MTFASSQFTGNDFVGSIPGQSANRIVQFYVAGVDALGAASLYPARGANSRALFVVQDNQAAPPPRHNFRIVMPTADAVFMHTGTNTLSNELLGCTVISNEEEVFYDVGVRLKGSFVGRNAARVGFHVAFNPEQLFRGVHQVVSVDRAQQGLIGGIAEVIAKHIASHAGGIPSMHDDCPLHCTACLLHRLVATPSLGLIPTTSTPSSRTAATVPCSKSKCCGGFLRQSMAIRKASSRSAMKVAAPGT
jgi:hypothetical protein